LSGQFNAGVQGPYKIPLMHDLQISFQKWQIIQNIIEWHKLNFY